MGSTHNEVSIRVELHDLIYVYKDKDCNTFDVDYPCYILTVLLLFVKL